MDTQVIKYVTIFYSVLENIQINPMHGKVLAKVPKIYCGKASRYESIYTAFLHGCELTVTENESIVLEVREAAPLRTV